MTISLKSIIANTLLLAVSLLIAVGVAELVLRFGMSPERLVPNAPETPALNERRNALRFYARQRERIAFGGHDRWLGWDSGNADTRVRGRETVDPPTNGNFRIIALGDSFTWGNEVAADENFAHLLDVADNGLEVLNMGVPGYGIDQMVLKYERHGARLMPDLIILGIYVSDYERSTVAFTAASKPLFQVVGDELVLTNNPVPPPAVVVEQIGRSLRGRLHLQAFVENRLPGTRQDMESFFNDSDQLVGRLLHRLKDGLRTDQRLLVLHIPRGESFTKPDPFHQEMSSRLRSLYQRLDLEVLDVEALLAGIVPPEAVPERFYQVRESGSVGHLNPAGHAVLAEAIAVQVLRQPINRQ